jgi:hypothetical protein
LNLVFPGTLPPHHCGFTVLTRGKPRYRGESGSPPFITVYRILGNATMGNYLDRNIAVVFQSRQRLVNPCGFILRIGEYRYVGAGYPVDALARH